MTGNGTDVAETSTVQWVGVGLDGEVGYELAFDRPTTGRFPTTGRRAIWVQDRYTFSAELAELPTGDADQVACLRVLSAVGAPLVEEGFTQVTVRRLVHPDQDRMVQWYTRSRGPATDHQLLLGVCTERPTLATLRVFWSSLNADPAGEWPEVRPLLEQWKVTVR